MSAAHWLLAHRPLLQLPPDHQPAIKASLLTGRGRAVSQRRQSGRGAVFSGHMLQHVIPAAGLFAADRTRERAVSARGRLVARPHVLAQSAQVGVPLAARGARVGLLARVRAPVARDARQSRSPASTEGAKQSVTRGRYDKHTLDR